jgi:hypothetical protein
MNGKDARGISAANLELWPIGNCQVSALVDEDARFVWGCIPRVDGDPAFCVLLDAMPRDRGTWRIALEDITASRQYYLANTPVLVTCQEDSAGNAIEIIDFCPRFRLHGRLYCPVAFVRIVRPVVGSPSIRVQLQPAREWGKRAAPRASGGNDIRFELADTIMRLSTTAPVRHVEDAAPFRLERDLHFFLGADEPFSEDVASGTEAMLDRTIQE